MSHDQAPQDVFKQTHVPKAGMKPVPEKVNIVQHVDNASLLSVPEGKKGFQAKKTWTSEIIEFGNGPNVTTRLFERVIANGTAYQNMSDDRERKLKEFFAQP